MLQEWLVFLLLYRSLFRASFQTANRAQLLNCRMGGFRPGRSAAQLAPAELSGEAGNDWVGS